MFDIWGFNTWGIKSIHTKTFNNQPGKAATVPKPFRDTFITALRIHNLSLNLLAYGTKFSRISGSIRMLTGLAMCITTVAIGNPNPGQGAIVGHFYGEALKTGIAQIVRGFFEAFVPFGKTINGVLDVIATPLNLYKECAIDSEQKGATYLPDPGHPLPLAFLYLV